MLETRIFWGQAKAGGTYIYHCNRMFVWNEVKATTSQNVTVKWLALLIRIRGTRVRISARRAGILIAVLVFFSPSS